MGLDNIDKDAPSNNWNPTETQENHTKRITHSTPQLLLVTVEYTQGSNENGKLGKTMPKSVSNVVPNVSILDGHQLNILQPPENAAFSILQYNTSFIKDSYGQGTNGENRKSNEAVNQPHLLFLKGQICEQNKNTLITFSNANNSESFLNNDVVIAPLPETVVDANLTTEIPFKESTVTSEVLESSMEIKSELMGATTETDRTLKGDSQKNAGVEWESYSSGEGEESEIRQVISDKPVTCRAIASLPATFLYIANVDDGIGDTLGVFARKEIPKRTQFGPVEGVVVPCEDSQNTDGLQLTLSIENGQFQRIVVSNEHLSNWMRYVRAGGGPGKENLFLCEIGGALYYTSTRTIRSGEELRVWYSPTYASARSLPLSSEWSCQDYEINCENAREYNRTNDTNGLKKSGSKKYGQKYNLRNQDLQKQQEKNKKVTPFQKERKNDIQNNSNNFKKEEKEITKDKKWCCSHCQRCFSTATLLNLHTLTHAADNLETYISSSPLSSDNEQTLELEGNKIQFEQENKPLNCNICSKRFCTNSALACHIKSHADEKKFECPICNKVFDRILGLKAHICSHSLNGSFSCPYCLKKFLKYKLIRKHIRTFHSGRNHKCITCSKRFPTRDKLRMHELSHSDHRQFLCANCGNQFKRKDKLSRHMKKVHYLDKEKPPPPPKLKHPKKFIPKMLGNMNDYSQFIYKCHICMVGFKRRGMLVNHLAKRHPDISPESVPELNLPILKATRDYYCQYCDKIYKSSSKRKAHILKNHPGAQLPTSNRKTEEESDAYSQTVGSVTTNPQNCSWCHKQYASKAKLLQHQRSKHPHLLPKPLQKPRRSAVNNSVEEIDSLRYEELEKVTEGNISLQDPLCNNVSEYEIADGDSHCFTEGEFIIDAHTLKKALRGEMMSTCLPESIAELGQLIADSRPDQYFKVIQTSTGISFAQPVEIWDPLSSLSPSEELDTSPFLAPPYAAR